MNIAGVRYSSFVDYPGHIAAVVFTRGCNMRCPWCHNYSLISPVGAIAYAPGLVLSELKRRENFIDALVVSGGEPTMQKELGGFLRAAKSLGLKTKLDTNGTNPGAISRLLDDDLLDYIAMDVKAPFELYPKITGISAVGVEESIEIIKRRAPDYEFRTTFIPELAADDILKTAGQVAGAKRYYLQQYRPTNAHNNPPHSPDTINETLKSLREILPVAQVRGL